MPLRERLIELFPRLRDLPAGARLAVGGAIRDLLLGREPNDVDVECDDPLAVAQSLGRKVIQLGREGMLAWRVVDGDRIYDFSELSPLSRRDFTINAIAVDLATGETRDPHGGARDIEARLVRMIEAKNFDDDPLRMLRAVRFAVTLGFEIDDATLAAVRARAAKITSVASERIDYELSLIFSAGAFRRALALLRATALLEIDPSHVHADDVSLAAAYAVVARRAAGMSPLEDRLQPVHLRRDIAALQQLVEKHDRLALYDAGERVARQLPPLLRALGRDDTLDWPDFSIRALLAGDEIPLPPGPRLGEVKRALLEAQIRGEVRSREEAVTFVRKFVSNSSDSQD
jgi:tRNA nucleotidyltransferase (CCA-adding enzyme)